MIEQRVLLLKGSLLIGQDGKASHDLINLKLLSVLLFLNLLLHLVQLINLLRHLGGGVNMLLLEPDKDTIVPDVGLLKVPSELVDLRLPLLVEVDLGRSGATGLVHSLGEVVLLSGQGSSLLLSLSAGLPLGLKLLLLGLNSALELLDCLLQL